MPREEVLRFPALAQCKYLRVAEDEYDVRQVGRVNKFEGGILLPSKWKIIGRSDK